ncbi:hypothetical protein Hanom_Chr17g01524611 [Helianthus anomalus]
MTRIDPFVYKWVENAISTVCKNLKIAKELENGTWEAKCLRTALTSCSFVGLE